VYGPLSYVIFLLGVAFAYFLVIPISIKFLLSFSSEILTPMITVKSYLMYVWMMMVVFGGVFELPIILMFLTKIGIATPAFLADKRKYAVVTILTVSALITPPDVITQLILSFPLIILYEVGIMASKAMQKKK
ncbi:MAG: twin-arginine translocase subunit TatC, partial [Candidatus Omnitrophica bacterium]|nr:twin-arginine translocase subunit TatC [Candidatus Omnitrophota bacterium]